MEDLILVTCHWWVRVPLRYGLGTREEKKDLSKKEKKKEIVEFIDWYHMWFDRRWIFDIE